MKLAKEVRAITYDKTIEFQTAQLITNCEPEIPEGQQKCGGEKLKTLDHCLEEYCIPYRLRFESD